MPIWRRQGGLSYSGTIRGRVDGIIAYLMRLFPALGAADATKILIVNAAGDGFDLSTYKIEDRLPSWVYFNGADGTIYDDYDVTAVGNTGTGTFSITWDTDFTNVNYSIVMSGTDQNGTIVGITSKGTGSCDGFSMLHEGTLRNDTKLNAIAFGDK